MSGPDFEQSIPFTVILAAFGGILEVFATAVLAYPAARMLEGYEWTDTQLKLCLAANLTLQILASLSGNLFATWFGPVAIVGPMFFAAQLLANLVVFWIVLGLESFSREMQIGTYVIVVSVILLIVNGPGVQDYGDDGFTELMESTLALIWGWILFIGMVMSGGIVMFDDLTKRPELFKILALLVARASAFSINLSTGKALVLDPDDFWFYVSLALKIISGIIYTRAIVVQSTAVQQKVFVPLNAAMIIFINAATGVFIWRDAAVVQSWMGYICVFLLLVLGCGLLLGDFGLLQETAPETFRGARPSLFAPGGRTKLLENLKDFGHGRAQRSGMALDVDDDDESYDSYSSEDDEVEYEGKNEGNSSSRTSAKNNSHDVEEEMNNRRNYRDNDHGDESTTKEQPSMDNNALASKNKFPMRRQPSEGLGSSHSLRPPQTQDSISRQASQGINPAPGSGLKKRGVSKRPPQGGSLQPAPSRRHHHGHHHRRSTRNTVGAINQKERAKQAWIELYGRSKAAPRISAIPTNSGKSRVLWKDVQNLLAQGNYNDDSTSVRPPPSVTRTPRSNMNSIDEGLDEEEEDSKEVQTSAQVTEDSSSKTKPNNTNNNDEEEGSATKPPSGESA